MKIRKKILIVLITIFLLMIVVLLILFCINNKNNNIEKQKFEQNDLDNKKKIENLNNEIQTLKEQNEELIKKDCRYTETYFFVDYYDYQGTVPTDKYIIVDKFQTQEPLIIRYNSSKFKINFEKGKNYEFTFISSIEKGVEYKKIIVDIKPTERGGLDQIQESCYYHDN